MKRQFTTGVSPKTSPSLYNFSVGSYSELLEENFKVSSKSGIVEDGIHKRIIYGKVKKLIADYRGAGFFT